MIPVGSRWTLAWKLPHRVCACGCGTPTKSTYSRGHNPRRTLTEADFWARVDTQEQGCWRWLGAKCALGAMMRDYESWPAEMKMHCEWHGTTAIACSAFTSASSALRRDELKERDKCLRCKCEYDPRFNEDAEGRESSYCRACWWLLRYGSMKR